MAQRERNLPFVHVSRVRSHLPYNADFHLHENYEIYLLIDGEIDYFVEHTCYRLTPGSLILFDDKTIHKCSNALGTAYERATVHFNPHIAKGLGTEKTDLLACFRTIAQRENIVQLTAQEVAEYLSLADRILQLRFDRRSGTDVLQRACLMELLVLVNRRFSTRKSTARAVQPAKVTGSRLRPLLDYIDNHLTENLSLDALAQGLSMSKSNISHIFKEETGSTPSRYITTRRIALAKHLLRSGCTVTEACMQSGFNDYANFIRVFKTATGVSPGQYKKDALSTRES